MKRFLFLVQLPPPHHGAAVMNRHVLSIIKKNRFKFNIIPLKFITKISEIRVFSFKKILKMFFIAISLIKKLFYYKPDVVYFSLSHLGGAFYRDVFYVLIIKLFNVKIIYHLHGKGVNKNRNNFFNNYLYEFVFKNTTVIHLSPLLENDILNLGYKKIHFLPNAIDLVDQKKIIKQSNIVPKLLFLSNLSASKGVLDLIDACSILNKKGLKFHLDIVGNEKDISFDYLKKKINNLNLNSNVSVLGPMYSDSKNHIFYNSDIFVHPTHNDAFPLVLLEAMQFGIPIISTYEGAIAEIVDESNTGFLFPKKNIFKLAQKIEILIKDKKKRLFMGQNGKKKFLEQYTLDIFEKDLIKILTK